MSSPRFLVRSLPASGTLALDEAEARHASSVLRLQPGSQVVLFDGVGGEAIACIEETKKRSVVVSIEARTDTNRELPIALVMLVALPKGDRQKMLVEGLVQLGVTSLIPLVCQRAVAQPTQNAIQRLQRSVIESSKQCGRNRLMTIEPPQTIATLCSGLEGERWFAHPYGESPQTADRDLPNASELVSVAIGPEGGFADDEVHAMQRTGWQQMRLGSRILRIEMAALAAASWHALRFA